MALVLTHIHLLLISVVELWYRLFGRGFRGAWKLRVDRCGGTGVCSVARGGLLSSSAGVDGDGGGTGGRGPCRSLRLVKVVEEALFDASRVRVVLVEE